jgi:hypothetical protein
MQVYDLDGNSYSLQLVGNITRGSLTNKSSLHLKARDILKGTYPTMQILEEVTVYTHKSEVCYLDFYVPLIKTCIEVHGEQHYTFTPFYHNNRLAFLKAQKKDRDKKEWCDINNINYIELPYHSQDKWESLIRNE